MPVPASEVPWWGSLLWLIGVAAAAFVVSWITGTRLHIRRFWYIPLLSVVTGALSAGYIFWLGIGVKQVITGRWAWGLLAAVVEGVILAWAMTHQPVTRKLGGRQMTAALVWEGVVYGIAEGILLSALPAFVTWQIVHSLGWNGAAGAVARWTLPIVAAAVVIVVHHLGYWNCRNRILVPITLGCSVLTVGYLVTASWLAPAVGHVFMHFAALVHGVEMPPVERPAAAPTAERPSLPMAA